VGESGYLDCQQIREIAKKGHEIGSHGQTHQNLCTMDEKQVLTELVTSKTDIEELINKEILGFSYPFGYFDNRIKALIKLTNYKYARTGKFGNISFPPLDWFEWNPCSLAQGKGGYRKKFHLRYFQFLNLQALFKRSFPKDWVEIAYCMIRRAYTKGGLFHLWGHSTSLSKKDDLKKLDMFLSSVSNFPDIWFARNKDIFRYEMTKRFTLVRINRVARKKTEIAIEINPKIEPTAITVEVEKPDSSVTFTADHLSIQKRYQGKRLFVTFSPVDDKIIG